MLNRVCSVFKRVGGGEYCHKINIELVRKIHLKTGRGEIIMYKK